jgi:hypothetical protein
MVFAEELWSVGIWGELGPSTVGNWNALVWQEMGIGWPWMFKLNDKVLHVAKHTDTTPAGCVVLLDVNTHKFVAGHVELDPMELLQNIAEMVEVFCPNILQLHPKVINYEAELDGTPFVVPEAWGGFGLVIFFSKKAGLEEIVGKNAGLGKAITALANLKVDPPVTITTLKVVILNEFCQNVSNFNADVFGVWYWSIKVEVLEVDGVEMCAWARKHASEKKLFASSRDAVLVLTLPGKQMQLLPMVMQVQSGSSFSGRTSHTTMVW